MFSDEYVGTFSGGASDIYTETIRKDRLSHAERVEERYNHPRDKILKQAVEQVVEGGVLPYHLEDMPKKGNVFVCWSCNNGGLYGTSIVPYKKQPKGIISVGPSNDLLANLRVHKSRGDHKNKPLRLLDMTGHQLDPIKKKMEVLDAKVAELKTMPSEEPSGSGKGKAKAVERVSGEDEETLALQAEWEDLDRQVRKKRMREEIAELKKELGQEEPTQLSRVESS